MQIIRDATEDEMVLAFLQAEIDSPNYGPCLAPFGDVIEIADLADEEANFARRGALSACRGYPDKALFTGFPSNVDWKLMDVTVAELGDFRYLNNQPRREQAPPSRCSSGGGRRPARPQPNTRGEAFRAARTNDEQERVSHRTPWIRRESRNPTQLI